MRRATKLLWCALFCTLASPWLWAGVAIPDWMREASKQALPAYPADTNAVVLLSETTYRVLSPGEYEEHARRVVKILRHEGRREGTLTVYGRKGQKVHSLHAWTIDKEGKEFELKDKDFAEAALDEDSLYSDIRARIAQAPAADPGSVIAFEYELVRPCWDSQETWFFQGDLPVHEISITLALPQGWEFQDSWAGTPRIKPSDLGGNQWRWTLRDLPPIEEEERMPAFLSLSARATVAFLAPGGGQTATASWNAIGRWDSGLTAGRRDATPEIKEKVQQLVTSAAPGFDGKLRAISAFLQSDIRYVAIEIGIGGFQPHPAADVFHYRYGDCKDKATLLSTMLQEVGIRSEYVIIHTERGIVDPAMPSTFFNHAILAIELPDKEIAGHYRSVITAKSGKQYLIFDPTDTFTPVGTLRGELQDTYALLVTDPGGEMIHTPLLAPETNLLARTGHFTLSADGILRGEVVEESQGDSAFDFRASLHGATDKQRTERLDRILGESLKGFTLENSKIEHLDDIQKDLRLGLKFTARGYAQVRGPLMLVRARVLGENSFTVDNRKPRQYPVVFEGTRKVTDSYEIELPPGYAVDDLPEPTKIDSGFAAYESKFEVNGSRLHYSREYTRRDVKIDAVRMAEFRKFEGAIGADENAAVVLKKIQ